MNSPLIIFQKYLPQEIINNIQQYLPPNDFVYKAIKKYFTHLRKRQQLYIEFAYKQYILNPCCGHKKYKPCLNKNNNILCKQCNYMKDKWKGRNYWISSFTEIFYENLQYSKIVWYGVPKQRIPYHFR